MEQEKQSLRPFLRVFNTDLIGEKEINMALLKIKGVGFSIANAVCNSLNINRHTKAGTLSDAQAREIENVIKNKLPIWMFNRRSDFYTGESAHLVGADLKFEVDNDIKMMKKIKTYRGMRHAYGQPVRGQRTRSHFRKGRAVGVQKTKIKPSVAAATSGKKKE